MKGFKSFEVLDQFQFGVFGYVEIFCGHEKPRVVFEVVAKSANAKLR